MSARHQPPTVGLISLGCAKNLVDSEVMLGHLAAAGMALTPDPELADVLIVNTCSFIDPAKEESVNTILEVVAARAADPARAGQKIIVAGCLPQRFSTQLPGLLPEVDAFVGLDQVHRLAPLARRLLECRRAPGAAPECVVGARPRFLPGCDTPRLRLTPGHLAYVKIAEGCNHPCSFCIIPQVRGRYRSRTVDSVVREVEGLVRGGVREVNLISQDSTYFGMDRWRGGRPGPRSAVDSARGESVASLLRALDAIDGDFWIRLLYTHPAHWSDELIETIAGCGKVARYVDIPLQHISDRMLEAMRRETDGAWIRDLLRRLRAGIPRLALRTTFIVGFPGETEEDFAQLLAFIEEARFERAGVFQYSREEGTRAHGFGGHLHHMTRNSRWRRAMLALQRIAGELNRTQVGLARRVLVEEPGIARTEWDAPEIDATVRVDAALPVGQFATVTITGWQGYDLVAAR